MQRLIICRGKLGVYELIWAKLRKALRRWISDQSFICHTHFYPQVDPPNAFTTTQNWTSCSVL